MVQKTLSEKNLTDYISKYSLPISSVAIYLFAILLKIAIYPSIPLSYDEIAYSITAKNIVLSGSWLNIYGSTDLFFFPPLFNWLSAILIRCGVEQVVAVRAVSMVVSSGIPVMIYLLMVKSGFSKKSSFFASLLWIIFPSSIYYSVVGQVETTFLFFVLLSLYAVSEKREVWHVVASAFFLAAAVWVKETALGFVFVFTALFLLKKEFKALALWGASVFLFCLPLFIQSLLPNEYDLFFELSNDLINWKEISFSQPFENLALLAGFFAVGKAAKVISVLTVFALIATTSIIAFKKHPDSFLIKFAIFSNLVFLPFFMIFPKKFEYYLLPTLLFSTVLIVASLKNRAFFFMIIISFTIWGSFNGLKQKSLLSEHYSDTMNLLMLAATEKPGASVGVTTPHIAIYIKERHNLDLKIVPLDFFSGYDPNNCKEKEDRCILKNDYFLSNDEFFLVLFCKKWPIEKENCDLNQMKKVVAKIKKEKNNNTVSLYKCQN